MSIVRDVALRVARQWGAREEHCCAVECAQDVNSLGMCALVNCPGVETTDLVHIARSVDEYINLTTQLKALGLCSSISLEASQIGIIGGVNGTLAPARTIIEAAGRAGLFVWFDMERYVFKNATLDLFHRLHEDYQNIGVCIQASLYDSWNDLHRLVETRSIVRVVKGAYRESRSLRYSSRREIRQSFLRCVKILGERTDLSFAVGTHDEYLIREIRKMKFGLSPPEFQFLYGVKDGLKRKLVDCGYVVSVYIPHNGVWVRHAR